MNTSEFFIIAALFITLAVFIWLIGFNFGVRWALKKHNKYTAAIRARGQA